MEQQQDNRAAKLVLVIGTNGTGKTTILKNIIQNSLERSLIITPDCVEWLEYEENKLKTKADYFFEGINRHIYLEDSLKKIDKYTRGTLIFDDCRSYLKASTAQEVRNLIIRRRQRQIDIFAVGHGFTEIPPVFFTFATDIILFRTTDNIIRRKDCLKDYEAVLQLQQRINKKSVEDPHYYEILKFS